MPAKHRTTPAILLICVVIALVASLISASGWLDLFELKTADARFRLRYWAAERWGRVKVSDQVVLAAVDQKSVDPAYSDFSDRWGMGGWLTRDHWTRAVYNFARYYKPGVVAYDILFMPYRPSKPGDPTSPARGISFIEESIRQKKIGFRELTLDEQFPRLEVLELLDASGNEAFADSFNNVDDLRASGQKTPDFVAAYFFTRSGVDSAPSWKLTSKDDEEKIKLLKKYAIAPALIRNVPADYPYLDNVNMPYDSLAGSAVHLGFINVDRDPDGNIRRIPLVYGFRDPAERNRPIFVPSLALEACLLHLGIDLNSKSAGLQVDFGNEIRISSRERRIRIPIDRKGCLFLNFTGKVNDFQPVPYADINRFGPYDTAGMQRQWLTAPDMSIAEKIHRHIDNKIVLVGLTFTGATDVGPCAIDSNAPFSLIHLTAIDNILRQSFLTPAGPWIQSGVLVVLLALAGWINTASRARVSGWGTSLLFVGYLAAAFLFFFFNVSILPVVIPALSMIVAFAGISLFRYQVEQKGRLDIRKKFSTMVSGDLLEQMEENAESLALGGERRDVTVFFSDVAGFTHVAETLSPEKLVEVINTYLTPMTEIILESHGYLNKFLGDGIMAVWGAPLPLAEHARQACLAALAQQQKIDELRPVFREKFGVELKVRMGINTGPVDAGNMGSLNRFEYTVMGDAVNLAARLEPANKDYGSRIIIARGTFEQIQGKGFAVRLLDRIVVEGKTEPVEIYELQGLESDQLPDARKAAILFEEGLRLYWERRWDQALERFEAALKIVPDDEAARRLTQRVCACREKPPAADWKGEYVREGKS